jgi:WhiB family redox-sensing transcriptional regulator
MARKTKNEYPATKYIYKPDEFNWHEQAACKDLPTDMFYYNDDERGEDKLNKEIAALAVCKTCPVTKECLRDAIQRKDNHSIQGGTTPNQRGYRQSTLPIEVVLKDL